MDEQELINEVRRHGLAILAALERYFTDKRESHNKEVKEPAILRRN